MSCITDEEKLSTLSTFHNVKVYIFQSQTWPKLIKSRTRLNVFLGVSKVFDTLTSGKIFNSKIMQNIISNNEDS